MRHNRVGDSTELCDTVELRDAAKLRDAVELCDAVELGDAAATAASLRIRNTLSPKCLRNPPQPRTKPPLLQLLNNCNNNNKG